MTTYLIKLVVCSGLLLLAYHLLLKKETMHHYNRFFLLFSVALSVVIPFVSFEWQEEKAILSEPVYIVNELLDSTLEASTLEPTSEPSGSPAIPIVLVIYLAITMVLFLRFCRNLFSLLAQTKNATSISYHGSKLILTNQPGLPFSFLHYIFINREEWHAGKIRPEILLHELTHIRQKHSWDILLTELLLIVGWFNPFFYGFKKAIRLNHEFLADAAVVHTFPDKRSYQQLLLQAASNGSHQAMTSSFNYLITKKRLLMMFKTTSPISTGLRQTATVLSTLVLVFLLSTKIMAQQENSAASQKTPNTNKSDTPKMIAWVGQTIGFTKEGVSDDLLKEYQALVAKYFDNDLSPAKQSDNVTEEDRARMEEIFRQMNPEQQGKQRLAFLKPPKPLSKVVPTKTQFEKFKNAKVYGVWIDEKKVSNNILSNYSHTDFSQVFISKLYGAAKKGRTYTHQLDLMTNDHYKKYFEEASKNKRSMMVFRSVNKTKISGYE